LALTGQHSHAFVGFGHRCPAGGVNIGRFFIIEMVGTGGAGEIGLIDGRPACDNQLKLSFGSFGKPCDWQWIENKAPDSYLVRRFV
jgi:hypothetical protein